MQQRQVGGNEKIARAMPACPVVYDHAVRTRRHSLADNRQMLVHRRRVGPFRHMGDADAALRAGGAEQIDEPVDFRLWCIHTPGLTYSALSC